MFVRVGYPFIKLLLSRREYTCIYIYIYITYFRMLKTQVVFLNRNWDGGLSPGGRIEEQRQGRVPLGVHFTAIRGGPETYFPGVI